MIIERLKTIVLRTMEGIYTYIKDVRANAELQQALETDIYI